jgi:hypothetical protein
MEIAAQTVPDHGVRLAVRRAVECWIGVTDEPGRTTVRLAGRLRGPQVHELTQVCGERPHSHLVLDLSDLLNADAVGIAAIRKLRLEGATLVGVSQYLGLKLDSIA